MRCEHLHTLLPGYLEGSLSGRQNGQISDHLDGCERCHQELLAQQRALRALDAGRHPVTIDLWADFSRRLQSQSPAALPRWAFLRIPGTALAAAAVVVGVIASLAAPPKAVRPPGGGPGGAVRIAQTFDRLGFLRSRTPASRSQGDTALLNTPALTAMAGAVLRSGPAAKGRTLTHPPHNARPSRRIRHHSFHSPVAHPRARTERSQLLLAQLTYASPPDIDDEAMAAFSAPAAESRRGGTSASGAARADREPATHSVRQPEIDRGRSGDPLRVAVALASVEQDTASDQLGGELLRMAREVTRMSGEAVGSTASGTHSGARESGMQPDDNPTGT